MASGKEVGVEAEVASEAVGRSEVGVGEAGVGLGVASVLMFTDQRIAEPEDVVDGEGEGAGDAGVLVLQVMGVMESSLNTSVTGAVQTRLSPMEPLSLTTQRRVPPSPSPKPKP